MSSWLDSKRQSEEVAYLKTVIRNSDNRLVGATAISQEADVLINYVTLALNEHTSKQDFEKQLFAYPSLINDLIQIWK